MKLARLFPLLILPLAISCSSGNPSASGTTGNAGNSPEAAVFKVALLTPGPVSDSGWNAMAFDGLQAIKTDMGATVDNQQVSGPQIRDALRSYAQKGYNLVFGHGYEYNDPSFEVAKDFPDTVFVSSSGGKTAKNVGAFRFTLEQGFYLAGMMGAMMTKTGKIGSVSLGGIPSIDSTLEAFEAGAREVNPKIELKRVRIQTDGDVASAKQATEQLADAGFDFVIHQANSSAQGVFDAAKEKHIYAFGANQDQNSNSSGAVIASAVIIAKPAFLALAKEVQGKTFQGRVVMMGMKDGAIDFVINPAFEAKVPEDVKKRLSEKAEAIKGGTFEVPMATF
jgi:basic membrane lipoprotein Med (substrate-binding protein (PBP1-ABC) superfamily)